MTNQKKACLAIVCMLLGCFLFVSCGMNQIKMDEPKEFVFRNCKLSITLPYGWQEETTIEYITYHLFKSNPKENYTTYPDKDYIASIYINSNPFKSSLNGDEGVVLILGKPYEVGKDNINSSYDIPNIDDSSLQRFGDNQVYISAPLNIGAVYLDKKMILPIEIVHWPKNGMTTEMESFFSSLHVD